LADFNHFWQVTSKETRRKWL